MIERRKTTSVKQSHISARTQPRLRDLTMLPRRVRFWITRESRRIAWSIFLLSFILVFIDSIGFVKLYFEKDFHSFNYPLDVPNFQEVVHAFRKGESSLTHHPINLDYSRIKFLDQATCTVEGNPALLILVKSAPNYFDKRKAIRETWGNAEYLANFSKAITSSSSPLLKCLTTKGDKTGNIPFTIKLVFLIGRTRSSSTYVQPKRREGTMIRSNGFHHLGSKGHELEVDVDSRLLNYKNYSIIDEQVKDKVATVLSVSYAAPTQSITNRSKKSKKKRELAPDTVLEEEILKFNDIVFADFIDSYENNTFKTMVGLRWVLERCPNSEFVLLADDDMFISIKNLIRFMENPENYPFHSSTNDERKDKDIDLKDRNVQQNTCNTSVMKRLYAGSKWRLSISEYPFNSFPPYIPAAAIVLSKKVVEDFYYASFFTEHFRFDDIYLGLLAYKMNITAWNSNYFHVCHTSDGKCPDSAEVNLQQLSVTGDPMEFVIARHGLTDPSELVDLWQSQTSLGNIFY